MTVLFVLATALLYQNNGEVLPTVMMVSWYGKEFQGQEMAYGGRFNRNDPKIAAHKTLPPGTELELYNPMTGKKLRVVVKDRGPNVPGRDLDISEAAAKAIGIKEAGHCPLLARKVLKSK